MRAVENVLLAVHDPHVCSVYVALSVAWFGKDVEASGTASSGAKHWRGQCMTRGCEGDLSAGS